MNNINITPFHSKGYENAEVINIQNKDGVAVVSSRVVAYDFDKQHKHVLKSIDNLIKDMGVAEKSADLFIESKCQHPQNKQWYKEYLLTRDGFSLLVMGFTGKEALQWKLQYIEAFNKMEEQIKQQKPVSQLDAIIAGLQATKELQEKMEVVEQVQVQQQQAIQNIRNVVAINTTDWRKDTTNIINRIAMSRDGGADNIHAVRKESYELLEKRANCKLSVRRKNLQRVMLENGVSKSKVDKITYLDVIERDNRLKEIYIAIVKEMAIKYNVA